MELKDFVANTITQIIEGVTNAQKEAEKFDAWVNPHIMNHNPNLHSLYFGSGMGVGMMKKPAFLLEFDVAIQSESGSSGKSGFGIFVAPFGAGTQAGSTSSSSQQNRIKFVVPYAFSCQLGKMNSQ